MKKLNNNNGFSLLEILLASIIFVLSVAGIFMTLNAVRAPVANKQNALVAANFGQAVLENLRTMVSGGDFYNSCATINTDTSCAEFTLSLGGHEVSLPIAGTTINDWPSTAIAGANIYDGESKIKYVVSCADMSLDCDKDGSKPDMARRVDIHINWPEAS